MVDACSPEAISPASDEMDYYYRLVQDEFMQSSSDEEEECNHNYIPLDGHYICNICGTYHPNKFYFYEDSISGCVFRYINIGERDIFERN